jgi:mRNA-degrading endonuclease toxin of MazEF toxin-antitoxin module
MEHGDWVEPQPMATTSLRLPADVIDELKQQARTRHVRYTTYVRSILERDLQGQAQVAVTVLPSAGHQARWTEHLAAGRAMASMAPSRIMMDKVTTVRRSKLGTRVGVLDDASILRLNRALVMFLGIASSVSGG